MFEDQPYFAGLRALATNGIDKPVLNTFRMFSKMGGERLAVTSDHEQAMDDILYAPPRGRGRRGGGVEPQEAGERQGGVRGEPDVSALASLDGKKLAVMVWHYHDDDVAGDAAAVDLTLTGLPQQNGEARLAQYRIDDEHSNSFTAWQKMGSPQEPTPAQYAELEKAGKLAQVEAPTTVAISGGAAKLHFDLPRQGVSLIVLEMN